MKPALISASEAENGGVRIGTEERQWIEARAVAVGFDLSGLAAAPEPGSAAAQVDSGRFAEFVELGRAGEMDWLKRTDAEGEFLRGELRRAVPWARSVLVCALNYGAASVGAPRSIDPAAKTAGWIARYAWSGRPALVSETQDVSGATEPAHELGSDYHDVLLPKLHAVEREIKERFGEGVETRAYVDTGPIVERSFAAAAGVGWIAKNTCVLNEEQGSWLLLGVVITSLEIAAEAVPALAADRCGSCTRCLEACPTGALVAPREMDASLCIAYLTIEKKGSIPEELREKMGRQVFGCDICQDVCPWNGRAARRAVERARESGGSADEIRGSLRQAQGRLFASRRMTPSGDGDDTHALPARRELVNPELGWLAEMDGAAFNGWFRGSPLERTRRKRVLRNVAIAMGNSGQQEFVPRLHEWARGEDAVLAEAAGWALTMLAEDAGHTSAG